MAPERMRDTESGWMGFIGSLLILPFSLLKIPIEIMGSVGSIFSQKGDAARKRMMR